MGKFTIFPTAYESDPGNQQVCTYVKQTLNSSYIKRGVYGHFINTEYNEKNLILAREGSLDLYSTSSNSNYELKHLCSAPVFDIILDLAAICSPHKSTKSEFDTCAVLTDAGTITLVRADKYKKSTYSSKARHSPYIEQQYRMRTVDQIDLTNGSGTEEKCGILRKLVYNPLMRVITAVSWEDTIWVIQLNWSDETDVPSFDRKCLAISVGGVICDAAILLPPDTERSRVLLVTAVIDPNDGSSALQMFELWVGMSAHHKPALLGKLPLPHGMSTPLHTIPLPELPDCFLLVTESEVAFVRGAQILSGDVHLYRRMLPLMGNNTVDSISAYTIVQNGTSLCGPSGKRQRESEGGHLLRSHSFVSSLDKSKFVAMDRAWSGPASPKMGSKGPRAVQRLYVHTHSGNLYCIHVTDNPTIDILPVRLDRKCVGYINEIPAGEVMFCLDSEGDASCKTDSNMAHYSDSLFLSGESTEHIVVKVCSSSASPQIHASDGLQSHPGILFGVIDIRPISENHTPMIDLAVYPYKPGYSQLRNASALRIESICWASGRKPYGVLNIGRLGRLVKKIYSVVDGDDKGEGISEAEDNSGHYTALVNMFVGSWTVTLPATGSNELYRECVILQSTATAVVLAMYSGSEWVVPTDVRTYIQTKYVIFAGNLYKNKCKTDAFPCAAIIIHRHGIDVLRIADQDIKPLVLLDVPSSSVLTHGTLIHDICGNNQDHWVIVASRSLSTSDCDSNQKNKSIILQLHKIQSLQHGAGSCKPAGFTIDLLHTLFLDQDISTLRSFRFGNHMYLAIGTYDPELRIYQVSEDHGFTLVLTMDIGLEYRSLIQSNTIESSSELDYLSQGGGVPNDIWMFNGMGSSHILLGLRDGTLMQIIVQGSLDGNPSGFKLHRLYCSTDIIGSTPVKFSQVKSSKGLHTSEVLVITSTICIAELCSLGKLNVVPCINDESCPKLFDLILPLNHTSIVNESDQETATGLRCNRDEQWTDPYLALGADGSIEIISLHLSSGCYIRSFYTGDDPRRILFDNETGLLIVAGVPSSLPQLSASFPTSCLKIINPENGYSYPGVHFKQFETICSLAAWHIKGHKSYRYICVGTGGCAEDSKDGGLLDNTKNGRLVIYNLKLSKKKQRTDASLSPRSSSQGSLQCAPNAYELKYVWESERPGPVTALAPLGDSHLVVAAGTCLTVLRLDVIQKRLIECCEVSMRFYISSLHVDGDIIVAGSQREAVHLFKFVPGSNGDHDTLEMMHSARFGLDTADACIIANDIVVGVSCNGYLFGLGIPEKTEEFALDNIFGIHLGMRCTKIRQAALIQRLHKADHLVPWDLKKRPASSVGLNESGSFSHNSNNCQIIVSTLLGTIWTLLRITPEAYTILDQLIKTMLSKANTHPATPLLSHQSISRRLQGNIYSKKNSMVIDGEYATVFIEKLTTDEQYAIVASSPELVHHALELYNKLKDMKGLIDSHFSKDTQADPVEIAADVVRCLIQDLNRTCIY